MNSNRTDDFISAAGDHSNPQKKFYIVWFLHMHIQSKAWRTRDIKATDHLPTDTKRKCTFNCNADDPRSWATPFCQRRNRKSRVLAPIVCDGGATALPNKIWSSLQGSASWSPKTNLTQIIASAVEKGTSPFLQNRGAHCDYFAHFRWSRPTEPMRRSIADK